MIISRAAATVGVGAASILIGTGLLAQPSSTGAAPLVLSAEIDGIIHPVAAQYVERTIARAEREAVALVVFTLRTPGGLVDSTR
jgi:membrane-bound ClpP family serine protease